MGKSTTYIPSGSKVTVSVTGLPAKKQMEISSTLKTPIRVGNEHVQTSVSIPAKKLPLLKKILGG